MKLIVAIVNSDDSHTVLTEITRGGFSATKLSTSGGFLRAGNVTLLIGTDDEKVDEVVGIIRRFSSRRTGQVQAAPPYGNDMMVSLPIEVPIGGATVFVLDVDKFIKL